MTTATYKGYTIITVGLSRYIYRPGQERPKASYFASMRDSAGYAQSMAEAKRWINADLAKAAPEICSCGYKLGHPGMCQGLF